MALLFLVFEEACRCFQNMSDEDKALIDRLVGGSPLYLQMGDKLSIEVDKKI